MNHGGPAGEVQRAHVLQPAAISPYPVGERAVDEIAPQDYEQAVGAELHALGDGPGDEGRVIMANIIW